ncbi:MAG: nucleotide sugar dehydrogenase [Nitrososphaerota archaeon]
MKSFFYDVIDKGLQNFTKDMNYLIKESDISFICVPTPTKNEEIDLTHLKEAVKNVGNALASRLKYHVVVIKSTILPGTTRNIVIPMLEEYSGKSVGKDFGVCVNPEFITEIEHTWTSDEYYKKDFFTEDRIVIGECDKKSGDLLEEIYKPLEKPIFRVELETAEMVKYASNCMLATKISYWNEIFLICKTIGVNSNKVAEITSLDQRIGKYGTIHGKAFGGRCLPKDLKAFISFAKKFHEPKLLKAVDEVNKLMKEKYGVRE